MTLPAFASIDQFSARVPGGLTSGDETRAQAALDDASTKVRAEAGRSWVDGGALDLPTDPDWAPDRIVSITIAAALRSFVNPDGVTQRSESLDGYSDAEQFATSSPDVYLTAQEKSDIAKIVGGRGGIGLLSITRSDISSSGVSGGLEVGCGVDDGTIAVDGAGTQMPFTYDPLPQ